MATASAATTGSACEYLTQKLTPDDEVYVLTVDVPNENNDRAAALDVAQVELSAIAEVRTIRRSGVPAREIVSFTRDREIDEIIMGPARATGRNTTGSTTRTVLNRVDAPVFVVPAQP